MDSESYSFVIPAYNDAGGLSRNFEYFFDRPEKIQLVIVDDASTDDTEALIALAKPPKNVRVDYHRQAQNAGPAAARNKGLAMATGDFIMFLDADDLLADCFFTYVNLSPLRNGADFVLFKYHLGTTDGKRYSYKMHAIDSTFFSRIETSGFPMGTFTVREIPSVLKTVNFPWNKIYRREFIQNAGISFPDHRMHEDILPHWHSFLRAKSFGILSWAPPLITHYETPGGDRATNYIGELRLGLFPVMKDLYREVCENPSADLFLPEFHTFCGDLFIWIIDVLCAGKDPETQTWRARYQQEIDDFCAFLETCDEKNGKKVSLPFWDRRQK